MVFIDPPYNVAINGHVCGSGAIRHREFAMAAGEMPPEQFTSFLEESLGVLAGASIDGAILFVCMDWRHVVELMSAAARADLELKNLVVWRKDNAGMKDIEQRALALNAQHRDWICDESRMARTEGGKALYLHCLPADIGAEVSRLSQPAGLPGG